MKKNVIFLLFIPLFISVSLSAETSLFNDNVFERCLSAVYSKIDGRIVKVEMKLENKQAIYEFDVRDVKNRDWDLECDVATQHIIEMEQEVYSISAQSFSQRQRVDYNQAKNSALQKFDGEILEVEFEVEESGLPVYEFDIQLNTGEIVKLEINAETGEQHEFSREIWQIGIE